EISQIRRPSSLHFSFNFTLLQAELGKPQRNCYTLPGFDFSYGLYIHRTDGGVPEAIGHWNTVKPRTGLVQKMPRDFITMNRGALKAGYTTAHEFNLYYKAKDIRRKNEERSHFKRCPPEVPADLTYGITTRKMEEKKKPQKKPFHCSLFCLLGLPAKDWRGVGTCCSPNNPSKRA
uniref:Cilia and flagella associated protein 77 n=1 Tax=Otus sunia TaxID=257818 RepID=A0A8C8B0U5_9STRI